MSEENKAKFRQVAEAFANGNIAAFDDLIAPDFIEHSPAPDQAPGVEGIKQMATMFRSAFPDLKVTIEDLIAEGDKVVGRMAFTGTHKGEFMGMAATNKQINIQEIHIVRISGGKMVEHWGIEDSMAMMQQLGMMPAQGA